MALSDFRYTRRAAAVKGIADIEQQMVELETWLKRLKAEVAAGAGGRPRFIQLRASDDEVTNPTRTSFLEVYGSSFGNPDLYINECNWTAYYDVVLWPDGFTEVRHVQYVILIYDWHTKLFYKDGSGAYTMGAGYNGRFAINALGVYNPLIIAAIQANDPACPDLSLDAEGLWRQAAPFRQIGHMYPEIGVGSGGYELFAAEILYGISISGIRWINYNTATGILDLSPTQVHPTHATISADGTLAMNFSFSLPGHTGVGAEPEFYGSW